MLESLFNKAAGLKTWRPATLLKRDSNTGVFLWILRNFEEHLFLQNTASFFHSRSHSSINYTTDVLCKETIKSVDTSHFNNLKENHKSFRSITCTQPKFHLCLVMWLIINLCCSGIYQFSLYFIVYHNIDMVVLHFWKYYACFTLKMIGTLNCR